MAWLPPFLSNYLNYLPLPVSDGFKLFLLLLALYLPFYLDGSEYSPHSRHSPFLHLIFRRFGSFMYPLFGLKPQVILTDDTLYNDKQYIFASHPHGVMSFHHALFFMDHLPGSQLITKKIPVTQRRALAARSLFNIPILRDILLACGAVDASVNVAKKCLESGYSITVLPGGEQEQLLAQYSQHQIYIKRRRGFCKLSLQYQIPIIPCYCFGETSTHHTSSLFLDFRQWLAKKYFIAIPIPIGWNFFFPLSTPLGLHLGKPIYPPVHDPTAPPLSEEEFEKRLNQLHEEYILAIKKIFHENKNRYSGHEEKELVIV
jgi:1-acyl-sn-glycerol-3-phosphate acyltransferase